MSESNRKKIKLLGFEPVQKAIVASLATLSRSRSIQYHVTEEDDIFQSDVLLIDVHDEVVIENWRQLKEIVGDLPVIAIGEQSVAGATVWVKRSQIATSLLDTMDKLLIPEQQESTAQDLSKPDTNSQTAQSSQSEAAEPSATESDSSSTDDQRGRTSWFRPSGRSAPSTDASEKTATVSTDSTEPESGKNVLFVTPDPATRLEGLASVAPKRSRTLPYAFGQKPDQKSSASADKHSEAKGSGDATQQLNEAKDELKQDNAAVSEKERLDNELNSVIKQIREKSARGEGGVVVDNEAPGLQSDNSFADPAKTALSPDPVTGGTPAPQGASTILTDAAPGKAVFGPRQQQSQANPTGAWPRSIVSPEESQHKNRFLIVDDSSYVWTQLRICLEKTPADLDFVSTAEDSLEEVKKRPYDLVFMDVMLPGMNGYDACKKIKKDKQSKHIPVIMLTGRSAPANKLKGVLSGCNYYMTKPVAEAEVQAVVDRFFTRVLKKSA